MKLVDTLFNFSLVILMNADIEMHITGKVDGRIDRQQLSPIRAKGTVRDLFSPCSGELRFGLGHSDLQKVIVSDVR